MVQGRPIGGLHALVGRLAPPSVLGSSAFVASQQPINEELWHKRFAHLGCANLQRVQHMVTGMDLAVGGIQVSPSCVGCLHGK